MKELSIYIHIPFCVRKCLYCDFLSAPADSQVRQHYVEALCGEIRAQGKGFSDYLVRTVFIGGGTPSVLESGQITRIMEQLKESFCLRTEEITIEVNPGSADPEKLTAYRSCGINRLSIGLQSADDRELEALGRIHRWNDFTDTCTAALRAGFTNINVDLMSALPGQQMGSWLDTLKRTVALSPSHISAYSLIIEEGTPFHDRYAGEGEDMRQAEAACKTPESNCPPLPSEDLDRQMYLETEIFLHGEGYHRYEISNYAKKDRECVHNKAYWLRRDYVGLGLGAASLVGNKRWSNCRSLERYLHLSDCEDFDGLAEAVQMLSTREQMEEFMFLGLRLMKGVSLPSFEQQFGRSMESVYGRQLEKLCRQGLIICDKKEERVRLTARGIDVSNYVFAEFLE